MKLSHNALNPPRPQLTLPSEVCNDQRFYAIIITPTLFGSWAMVREWDRIKQPGTVRETGFASEYAAVTASTSLQRRKECRGYAPVPSGLKTEDS